MLLAPLARMRRHARLHLGRPPRLIGAYPDHASALGAVPEGQMKGYDHGDIAEVSFEAMCRLTLWDYPVILWLRDLWRPGLTIVDAGGHMGTKYIAFAPHLPLAEATWCVLDLPAICVAPCPPRSDSPPRPGKRPWPRCCWPLA